MGSLCFPTGRRSRLAHLLLFMGSSASAALTLSDFQSITASTVPLGCILSYNNSPLSGCSQTDFTIGDGCSANCVRSLRNVQGRLQSVCADVSAPAGSVLRAAVEGSLVETLCGRGLDPPSTMSASPSSSSAEPQPAPPSTTPISSVVAPQPEPSDAEDDGPSAPTSTTDPIRASTAASQQTSPASAPPQHAGASVQRGGGSPFDAAVVSAAHRSVVLKPVTILGWTSAFGLAIMRQLVS